MEKQLLVFNNKEFGEVRVVMINGTPWFVGTDVAVSLGYKDAFAALKQHVDDEDKLVWQITSAGQKRDATVINESGLYSMILRSNLPKAREFKHWVTAEVIPAIRKTGSYSIAQPQSVLLKAASEIDPLSAILQNTFAVKRGIALSQAIDIVGNNYKLNFNSLKQLLPPADHETGYLNPTQIGERLGGLSAKVVNKLLAEAGLQYRDGKDWRLTDMGKEFGEEMPYTRNGHSGYQIRWNEAIVDYLTGKAA